MFQLHSWLFFFDSCKDLFGEKPQHKALGNFYDFFLETTVGQQTD